MDEERGEKLEEEMHDDAGEAGADADAMKKPSMATRWKKCGEPMMEEEGEEPEAAMEDKVEALLTPLLLPSKKRQVLLSK